MLRPQINVNQKTYPPNSWYFDSKNLGHDWLASKCIKVVMYLFPSDTLIYIELVTD